MADIKTMTEEITDLNIDIKEATNRGIIVMNMPDGNTISAAEHTIAMMMALSRNIQNGHMGIMSGEWNRKSLVGSELKGKILGVVAVSFSALAL